MKKINLSQAIAGFLSLVLLGMLLVACGQNSQPTLSQTFNQVACNLEGGGNASCETATAEAKSPTPTPTQACAKATPPPMTEQEATQIQAVFSPSTNCVNGKDALVFLGNLAYQGLFTYEIEAGLHYYGNVLELRFIVSKEAFSLDNSGFGFDWTAIANGCRVNFNPIGVNAKKLTPVSLTLTQPGAICTQTSVDNDPQNAQNPAKLMLAGFNGNAINVSYMGFAAA